MVREAGDNDTAMYVWRLVNGGAPSLRHTLTLESVSINFIKFSPDGKRLAVASSDEIVTIFSVKSGSQLLTFRGHELGYDETGNSFEDEYSEMGVLCAAWSPDSRLVASGGVDKYARVWDAVTGTQVMEPLSHNGSVKCTLFNASASMLITASRDDVITLWDMAREGQATVRRILQGQSCYAVTVSLSSDEKYLLGGECEMKMRLWSVDTGEQ